MDAKEKKPINDQKNTERAIPYTSSIMSTNLTEAKKEQNNSLSQLISALCPNWRNERFIKRMAFYNKYQKLIDLMDAFEVFTPNTLTNLATQNDLNVSRNTVQLLCRYLVTDDLLNKEIVPTGALKPAQVHWTKNADKDMVQRFKSDYLEHNRLYQERKKTRNIKDNSKEAWALQKEAAKELRKEENELLNETTARIRKYRQDKLKLPLYTCPKCQASYNKPQNSCKCGWKA